MGRVRRTLGKGHAWRQARGTGARQAEGGRGGAEGCVGQGVRQGGGCSEGAPCTFLCAWASAFGASTWEHTRGEPYLLLSLGVLP